MKREFSFPPYPRGWYRVASSEELTPGAAFITDVTRQFAQDIPIWENKIHLERPLLCDGDGPIAELRRWGRQFYPADALR